METNEEITTLFLDVGGVLLTNGWDRNSRKNAAEIFHLDHDEMQERHHLTFDTYEEGKITLDEYLNRVIFYKERPFSREEFKEFMFSQSKPHHDMIELIRHLKDRYKLKVAVLSNEGRELTEHRIRKFKLNEFIDFYIGSCFVHFRKPDHDIFRIALDISHVPPHEVVYIEDREMFVIIARELGIRAVRHIDFASTKENLAALGLKEKVTGK
jgi:putative hydrolase of the HAD superfamily